MIWHGWKDSALLASSLCWAWGLSGRKSSVVASPIFLAMAASRKAWAIRVEEVLSQLKLWRMFDVVIAS